MKRQLLVLPLLACLGIQLPLAHGAVTPGQIDEFNLNPTSTYGWTNGGGGFGIENIATGGPDTQNANDHFLQISAGNLGGFQKLITFSDSHWQGNFTNISGIRMDLRNLDTNVNAPAVPVRIVIRESNGGSTTPGYASAPFMLSVGNWNTSVFFPLTAANMTGFNSPKAFATDLANVADFRILVSATASGIGDNVALGGRIGIDNITAVASPPPIVKGDWDRNGSVTAADIPAMLIGLTDLTAYKTQKSLDDAGLLSVGDFTSDGHVTNSDMQPLLDLVGGGMGSIAAVPEPSAIGLACFAAAGMVGLVRSRMHAA